MKISSFNLNSLLAGLVTLLTFVLVLLYIIQPGTESYTYTGDNSPATYAEIQEIEQQITALEKLVSTEKIQAAEQETLQVGIRNGLKKQISELTAQLEDARKIAKKNQGLLDQEKLLAEQLDIQLKALKFQTLEQAGSLTSSDAEVLLLDKSLQLEKNYVQSLQIDYETEKLERSNLEDQLEQKKRELVRSKRDLAVSKQALTTKKRELTISQSRINDILRKNESLNRKLSILNNDANSIRQTSQDKALASSPNS